MNPVPIVLRYLAGLLLAAGVLSAVEHLTHRHDALGHFAALAIIGSLGLLGALIGVGAARRDH